MAAFSSKLSTTRRLRRRTGFVSEATPVKRRHTSRSTFIVENRNHSNLNWVVVDFLLERRICQGECKSVWIYSVTISQAYYQHLPAPSSGMFHIISHGYCIHVYVYMILESLLTKRAVSDLTPARFMIVLNISQNSIHPFPSIVRHVLRIYF